MLPPAAAVAVWKRRKSAHHSLLNHLREVEDVAAHGGAGREEAAPLLGGHLHIPHLHLTLGHHRPEGKDTHHGRLRTLQRLDALGEIHEAAALCIHHPARSGKRGDGGAQPPVVCQRPGVALRIAAPQIQTRDVTRQRRLNWREVNKLRPCRLKQRQVLAVVEPKGCVLGDCNDGRAICGRQLALHSGLAGGLRGRGRGRGRHESVHVNRGLHQGRQLVDVVVGHTLIARHVQPQIALLHHHPFVLRDGTQERGSNPRTGYGVLQPLGVRGAAHLVEQQAPDPQIRIKLHVALHHCSCGAGKRPAVQHQQHRRPQPLGHLSSAAILRRAVPPIKQSHHPLHHRYVCVRCGPVERRRILISVHHPAVQIDGRPSSCSLMMQRV